MKNRPMDNVQEVNNCIKTNTNFLSVNTWQEQGMDSQLWNMALLAGPREQLEAARYFESSDKALQDKAVILYHRAGMLHKALDLAFK
jgi:intraflagellar transport protein 140